MIKLPDQVMQLLNILNDCGYDAFAVGGCVRDSLLGRDPNDWDICTSASPEEMKQCFSDFRVIETGLKHGTLTVLVEEEAYEITTYRVDGTYSDGRHPDQVTFTTRLEDDLARRDFTINAMAYHPHQGLVDPFGGRKDLAQKQIRCVGAPATRFQEDALRILRAIRFASQLEFQIHQETSKALFSCLSLLDRISPERIRIEFEKLLCGSAAKEVLTVYRDVMAHVIPECRPMFDLDQKNPYHIYTVWDHTLHAVSHIKNTPLLKLAAFFHDIGKPGAMFLDEAGCGHFYRHEHLSAHLTDQVLRRLKYDNRTREMVVDIVQSHGTVFRPEEKQARRLLGKLGEEKLRLLIELEYADVKSQNPVYTQERVENIRAFSQTVDQVLAAEQCFSLKHLAVNGNDLISLGLRQGPEIGRILSILLKQVMEDQLPNEKAALLEAAQLHI